MTFITDPAAASPAASSTGGKGLSRSQLIELVNRRTERKADRALDLKTEFYLFLQDFCGERKWHWRRKTVTFDTSAGVATYDLSDTALSSDDASDVETIISVKRVKGNDIYDLQPIHGETYQSDCLESEVTGEPSGYFIEPGTTAVLRLVDIPNGAYKIRVTFWACPSAFDDSDVIPLVPPYLHNTLVAGFKAHVLKNLPGMESAANLAQAEYMRLLDKALDKLDFATGRIREFKSTEEAIRSV